MAYALMMGLVAQAGYIERNVSVHARLESATEHQLDYAITLHNRGRRSVTVGVRVADASLTTDGRTKAVSAWVDANHPFSTRVVPPLPREVPAGGDATGGELFALVEASARTPQTELVITLAITRKRRTVLVDMAPLRVR